MKATHRNGEPPYLLKMAVNSNCSEADRSSVQNKNGDLQAWNGTGRFPLKGEREIEVTQNHIPG